MSSSSLHGPSEGRLRELDGWRAISVMMVVIGHLVFIRFHNFEASHANILSPFYMIGPAGVKVFFVISGFVICRLMLLEEKRCGSVSIEGFYIRRLFRILPPFYLYLATLYFLARFGFIFEYRPAIRHAASFLYDFVPAETGSWFVSHTWSLAVEEQFYLLFPTLWILARRIGRARVFIGIFCLLAAWDLASATAGWNSFTTPRIRGGFACICCGVILAVLETRARAIVHSIPSLLLPAVALSLFWRPHDPLGWKWALYDSLYSPPAIALLLIFSLERGHRLRAFLCWKPVQAIGLTSYGIYLWQELFTASNSYLSKAGERIALLFPLIFVVIPLSYLFLEKPSMRLGRSLAEYLREHARRHRPVRKESFAR
jgi:peptidoglycan/LPS O-acetylase OafA/YrhL